MRDLVKNIREVTFSIAPVGIIVTILFLLYSQEWRLLAQFWIGALLLIVGLAIFQWGAEIGLQPMGEFIGSSLVKSRRLWIIALFSFILGLIVTAAEPDVQVLAQQVFTVSGGTIQKLSLIWLVAVGVGIFLVVAMLRVVFRLSLPITFLILYAIVMLFASFTDPKYLAVAFDAGGVTTGPMTVPFILALGVGVSSVSGSSGSEADSFGMVGIASIGPIMAVLLMGIFDNSKETGQSVAEEVELGLIVPFLHEFLSCAKDVAVALAPVLVIFILFQIFNLHIPKKRFRRMVLGIGYAFIGLTLFLSGVNAGLLPAGFGIGGMLGTKANSWVLVFFCAALGFAVVLAEPAVRVLNGEVKRVTGGAIRTSLILITLAVGVALGIGLSMLRLLMGFSIWLYILPGYAIALTLNFFVPKVFVGIAFDAGGVASGPLTATFLLALFQGVARSPGIDADPLFSAFGVVAMVAMMPLLAVQTFGLMYQIKLKRLKHSSEILSRPSDDETEVAIDE
jgi:hypothetical protein